jgi:prepilin peptidase CpaA
MLHSFTWWATVVMVVIATITDLRARRIPNWLVGPFLLGGVVFSCLNHGWRGLEQSALGVLLAAVLMGVLYLLGGMGMGDVKLCAALGAWMGPQQLLIALAAMGMTGGVMALIWAVATKSLGRSLNGASDLLFGIGRRGLRPHPTLQLSNPKTQKMPYAPAIAIGAIFSFLAMP